jgi:hypothetical protein
MAADYTPTTHHSTIEIETNKRMWSADSTDERHQEEMFTKPATINDHQYQEATDANANANATIKNTNKKGMFFNGQREQSKQLPDLHITKVAPSTNVANTKLTPNTNEIAIILKGPLQPQQALENLTNENGSEDTHFSSSSIGLRNNDITTLLEVQYEDLYKWDCKFDIGNAKLSSIKTMLYNLLTNECNYMSSKQLFLGLITDK